VSAGTSQGATAGTGQGATAGTGQGGIAGSSEAGEGGTGGDPVDLCRLPLDAGPCDGAIPRFYFNAERGLCDEFIYGGCMGNENNFATLEACHAACAGHGVVDRTSCTSTTECLLTAAQCCGGGNPPTLGDVTAVNAASLEEFTAPCQLVDCASTIYPIPGHFGATCREGHCMAFDVRETEYTDCSSPSDCRLRQGVACCEGCSGTAEEFVAVRADADLSPLVCGGEPIGCAACAPIPPGNIFADCVDAKCAVAITPE
jgi:hypothetical protein